MLRDQHSLSGGELMIRFSPARDLKEGGRPELGVTPKGEPLSTSLPMCARIAGDVEGRPQHHPAAQRVGQFAPSRLCQDQRPRNAMALRYMEGSAPRRAPLPHRPTSLE